MHTRLEQRLKQPKETPRINELLQFLEFQFQTMDLIKQRKDLHILHAKQCHQQYKRNKRVIKTEFVILEVMHYITVSNSSNYQKQLKNVQTQELCCNCFKGDHSSQNFASRICRKFGNIQCSCDILSCKDYALPAIARVRIIAANGNSAEFPAILDWGPQVNFVSERFIKGCLFQHQKRRDDDQQGE